MTKMNMVIGTFLQRGGNEAAQGYLGGGHEHSGRRAGRTSERRLVGQGRRGKETGAFILYARYWTLPHFDLTDLKRFLTDHRDFFLRLLENPNLLEHERFTDLLWAVFHLMDELSHRDTITEPAGKRYHSPGRGHEEGVYGRSCSNG